MQRPGPTLEGTSRFERAAWKWMRYSAVLLIPLVWIHSIIQVLITGGHNLSLEYVQMRWAVLGWRVYDIFLLVFAFSHGVNGLRQVLTDYVRRPGGRFWLNWSLFIFWILLTTVGAVAVIGGVRMP